MNDVSMDQGTDTTPWSLDCTYYIACFQVNPRRLLTAAAMLKTIEANQKQFTESAISVLSSAKENCRVVAVTAEKKVATVERLRRLFAPCF